MEHRWYRRMPVTFDVLLYRQGVPVALAQTRNLSKQGMLLEAKAVALAQNSVLEVEFTTGRGDDARNHRVSVVVVHGEDDRFGVAFISLRAEVRQAIRLLLSV